MTLFYTDLLLESTVAAVILRLIDEAFFERQDSLRYCIGNTRERLPVIALPCGQNHLNERRNGKPIQFSRGRLYR